MLHTQSHTLIVLLLLCAGANHHECNNSDVTFTRCSTYISLEIGRVTNRLLHVEMEHQNWQTSGSIALWGRVYNNNNCTHASSVSQYKSDML